MESIRDIMLRTGLLQRIHKRQAHTADGTPARGLFALQPEGGAPFEGVGVGTRYTVLQNGELADIADAAADRMGLSGQPRVTSWHGGRRVSVFLPLDRIGVGIGRADVTHVSLRLDNPHGGGSVLTALDLLRQVCTNGMTRRVGGSRVGIPHTLSVEERVRRVILTARGALAGVQSERQLAETLADAPLTGDALLAFFRRVHEAAYGPLATPEGAPKESAVQRIAAWVRAGEDERQRVAGVQGTAWAALQSVVQWADHEAPARDRRASADHGVLARVKAVAREEAGRLVGAGGVA